MTTKSRTADGIRITVRIPDKGEVSEYIREQKINQLYNLLAPKSDGDKPKADTEK